MKRFIVPYVNEEFCTIFGAKHFMNSEHILNLFHVIYQKYSGCSRIDAPFNSIENYIWHERQFIQIVADIDDKVLNVYFICRRMPMVCDNNAHLSKRIAVSLFLLFSCVMGQSISRMNWFFIGGYGIRMYFISDGWSNIFGIATILVKLWIDSNFTQAKLKAF